MDERLTDIEINLTQVSRDYDQLNEVVIDQARTIVQLERKIASLEARLKSLIATVQSPEGGVE